eukprot:CAMPEP_0179236340 /NCGR_PEP_ID=MMETSP0797-20121207/13877_1 /TAXON_ID=47934 /ORGANISM="Dinophysis acuminata, Strain DAEP01" /LENGTH=180 /DNA_ID=CAMNT_0020943593 /DNA_START=54 /DNA_END=596 /DNA_ORIENTATION=-
MSPLLSTAYAAFCLWWPVITAAGGKDENKDEMRWVYENDEFFANEAAYTTTKSGLKYLKLPGLPGLNGKKKRPYVKKGMTIPMMYKLYLEDGHAHTYSQATPKDAFHLQAGQGQVIKGFDEAALLMRYGDRGRFVMPGDIAYGSSGQPSFGIPGGAALEYFLEVHDAEAEAELAKAKAEL